jgi:hypothetical protein
MSRFRADDHAMYQGPQGKPVEVRVLAVTGTHDRRRYLVCPIMHTVGSSHAARFNATDSELTKLPEINL